MYLFLTYKNFFISMGMQTEWELNISLFQVVFQGYKDFSSCFKKSWKAITQQDVVIL